MSLLPNQLLPPTEPLGTVNGGVVTISKNWWLLFYNIASKTLGDGGIGPDTLQAYFAITQDLIAASTINQFVINGGVSWSRVGTFAFSDFAIGSTQNSLNLFLLGAAQIVHGIKIQHSTAFTGGSITQYTVSVGIPTSVEKYASAFDVFQAPGSLVYQLSSGLQGESTTAATQITVTATSDQNLNTATQGAVTVWALLSTAS